MTPYSLAPIAFILVRLLMQMSGKRGARPVAPDLRRLAWLLVAMVALLVGVPIEITLVVVVLEHPSPARIALLVPLLAAVAALMGASASPWSVLSRLARRGHYRLAYYLAQASPLFLSTGETGSGALLLAALALAHRPQCGAKDRAFVGRRLALDRRGLAAFGAALGLWHALEARAARVEGQPDRALELEETARAVFGTITYFSVKGAPLPVRRLADEYLALDAARQGLWGNLELLPEAPGRPWTGRLITPAARALRAFLRERLQGRPPAQQDVRAAAEVDSPLLRDLMAREASPPAHDLAAARARARRTYVALAGGQAVGPRAALGMLATYDHLLEPSATGSLLPPELRADEALIAALHDEAAAAMVEVLGRAPVPLHAMAHYGPISARVHHRLEAELFTELARAMKRLDELRARHERLDARGEWLEVSRVRALYRRLQFTLGDPAAARVTQQLAYSYGNLGVDMTTGKPLRRPLAHAVFRVLHGEAVRFGIAASVTLQSKNMSITSGPR